MSKGDKKNIILERRKPKSQQKGNLDSVDGRDLFQTPNYATELLIPFMPKNVNVIWECACGEGKIVKVLLANGYGVAATDLRFGGFNFLTQNYPEYYDAIITNPPFSLKRKFYEKCKEFGLPFALLIPADYSGWLIRAVQEGAEKIIPTRRIDYITPTGLSGASGHTAYYHSMWLTWGFGLGRTETFVELTNKMKDNI